MHMRFNVTYDGSKAPVEAVAKPKDIVAFERQYGVSMAAFADPAKPPPMEWLYYLAWSPLHRQGRETASFDAFLDTVEDIEPIEEPVDVPLDPTVSPEPSPS